MYSGCKMEVRLAQTPLRELPSSTKECRVAEYLQIVSRLDLSQYVILD